MTNTKRIERRGCGSVGLPRRGNVEQCRNARGVVHRTVVNAVAVDRLADADVVDVSGEHDVFVLEGRITAGKLGDHVGGLDGSGFDRCASFQRNTERKVRQRLAIFAEVRDFGKRVARTGKKFFSLRGVEGESQLQAGGFVELGSDKIHRRMRAIQRHARPRNVHRCGIRYPDGADYTGALQRLSNARRSLIVSGKRRGSVGRRTGEVDDDFAVQVEAGQIVVVRLWDFQAVADEDERRADFFGCEIEARVEVCVFAEDERLVFAVGDQRRCESFSTISRETNFTGW